MQGTCWCYLPLELTSGHLSSDLRASHAAAWGRKNSKLAQKQRQTCRWAVMLNNWPLPLRKLIKSLEGSRQDSNLPRGCFWHRHVTPSRIAWWQASNYTPWPRCSCEVSSDFASFPSESWCYDQSALETTKKTTIRFKKKSTKGAAVWKSNFSLLRFNRTTKESNFEFLEGAGV